MGTNNVSFHSACIPSKRRFTDEKPKVKNTTLYPLISLIYTKLAYII